VTPTAANTLGLLMIVNTTYKIPIRRKRTELDVGPLIKNITSFCPDKNPNIFHVIHSTKYTYTSPISLSKHLFRLQPLSDSTQTVLNYRFKVSSPFAQVSNFMGAFGNNASFIEIKKPYSELNIVTESVVCLQEPPQRDELIHQPRSLPLIWMPWDRIMMQSFLLPPELPESELFELAEFALKFAKKNHNDVFAVLEDINQTIYQEFSYESGSTSLETSAYEVFTNRAGVCQDFTNLLICLARLLNIPARYRVGYLYTEGEYENQTQAEETHAWAEIYLPYYGWIGFDPTNGCLAGKNHIRVACGRYYNDATPTSGTVFEASPDTSENLETRVEVRKINL